MNIISTTEPRIESLSAITLATRDMTSAVRRIYLVRVRPVIFEPDRRCAWADQLGARDPLCV